MGDIPAELLDLGLQVGRRGRGGQDAHTVEIPGMLLPEGFGNYAVLFDGGREGFPGTVPSGQTGCRQRS